MRRREFLGLVGGLALTGVRPAGGGSRIRPVEPRLVERWSWAMGQPVHIMLFHEDEAAGLAAAQAALTELRRVEARLSLFDEASDLVELNRHAGRRPMRVDADLLAVLSAAGAFRAQTHGAFNVAVEPLMRAWGFHQPRKAPPSEHELAEAREAVRSAVVRINGPWVALPSAHTRLDLGGIGVGYGLDRAAAVLRAHGVTTALIDVSGDLLALGSPPGKAGWPVEIANPLRPREHLAGLLLRDRALATSANTVSVVRLGGEIRGHVMDPERGYPADRVTQASALARSGMQVDALSTAMLVAGREFPGVERGWLVEPVSTRDG
jgi:thiamine biosynthesis lipoprotein